MNLHVVQKSDPTLSDMISKLERYKNCNAVTDSRGIVNNSDCLQDGDIITELASLLQASIHTLSHFEERQSVLPNPGFDMRVHQAEAAGEMRQEAMHQVRPSG